MIKVFLDSGAYAAWTRGTSIDLKKYIAFIKHHKKKLWRYVCLDVMPGSPGKRSADDCNKAAKLSYRNQQIMKDAGLLPIPVFHQGEAFSWLDKYIADNEYIIGLSTNKGASIHTQRAWLDEVFSAICDSKGRPLIRTHAFGSTSPPTLLRYPFTTADSSTWLVSTGNGTIPVPHYRDGKPDFSRPPIKIVMTGVTQGADSLQRRQFESLGEIEQEHIIHYIKTFLGFNLAQLRYGVLHRRISFVKYSLAVQEVVGSRRGNHTTFFGRHALPSMRDKTTPIKDKFRIIFTCDMTRDMCHALRCAGVTYVLQNFWEIADISDERFDCYIRTGYHKPGYNQNKQPSQKNWQPGYMNYRRLKLVKRIEDYATQEPA